jgi:hypothetical protein
LGQGSLVEFGELPIESDWIGKGHFVVKKPRTGPRFEHARRT